MKNKILVTGGAGFVGSTMVDKLIESPDNFVLIVDNLSTGNIKRLPESNPHNNWKFVKCAQFNRGSLYFENLECVCLFHFDSLG